MDIFLEPVNREEKRRADWTNWHILEQANCEETKAKMSVFSLLSLHYNRSVIEWIDKTSATETALGFGSRSDQTKD